MNVSIRLTVLLLCALVLGDAHVLLAQAGAAATKPIMKGFLTEFTAQTRYARRQVMALQNAMPAAVFTWRPGEGVRSVAEVYHHISFTTYEILNFAGYKPPADAHFIEDPAKWESHTTDKDEVERSLETSFTYLFGIMEKLSESDLERNVSAYGIETTLRGALMMLTTHLYEHLGQAIAYARMNGVVPPWTAAAQEREKKAKK